MLPSSLPLAAHHRGKPLKGVYELSDGYTTIARRVTLPRWLNAQLRKGGPLLPRLQANEIAMPEQFEDGMGQGDMLWRPQPLGFNFPVVGIDKAIFEEWILKPESKVLFLVFVLYTSGGREQERWVVYRSDFFAGARFVKGTVAMPGQFMAPITIAHYAPPP